MRTKYLIPAIFIISFVIAAISCNKDEKDSNPPVITLVGSDPYYTALDSVFTDPGATAWDEEDGDITSKIKTVSNVNTAVQGDYLVTYNVEDDAGNKAEEVTRKVKVLIF